MPGSKIIFNLSVKALILNKIETLFNFKGYSTARFVLLWFLPVAVHQDDLPAALVRLPAHPDVPHAEVHREEVPSSVGRDTSLTTAGSQEGAGKY